MKQMQQSVATAIVAVILLATPGAAITYLYLDGETRLELTAPGYLDATCDLAAPGNRITGELFVDVGADGSISAADPLVAFIYTTDGIPHLGDWEVDWIPGDDDSVANGLITSRWYIDGTEEPPGTTQFILRATDEDDSQAQATLVVHNATQTSAAIRGHVTEPGGAPVESAWVWAESVEDIYFGVTGADGFYTMAVVPGVYDVSAWEWLNPTHQPSETLQVTVTEGQTVTADLQMELLHAFITGTVAYETRQGIPGVWIAVAEMTGQDYFAMAVTGNAGDYSVGVVPGTYQVGPFPFMPEGGVPDGYYLYPPAYSDVQVVAGATVTGRDFQAREITSFIEGHTYLLAGGPCPGVTISALDLTTFALFDACSDDQGYYRLGVAPGTYFVSALKEEFQSDPVFIQVAVIEGQTVAGQDFTLAPIGSGGLTSIEGTVAYATRPPAENVYVVGWSEDEPSSDGWEFEWTDAHGFYRMLDVVPGDWLVAAYEPGYVAQPKIRDLSVSLGDTARNIDFTLGDVPVYLESFAATVTVNGVELSWATLDEASTLGFNIYRARDGEVYHRVNSAMITGPGGSYAFVDAGVSQRTHYFYRLEQVMAGGESRFHGPVAVTVGRAPVLVVLHGARPNPARGTAHISFTVRSFAKVVPVAVSIHDVRGSLVRALAVAPMPAGTHTLVWDGKDQHGQAVSTGSYVFTVRVDSQAATGRVLLLR